MFVTPKLIFSTLSNPTAMKEPHFEGSCLHPWTRQLNDNLNTKYFTLFNNIESQEFWVIQLLNVSIS